MAGSPEAVGRSPHIGYGLELLLRRHLLGEQGGLDAMEQIFEPVREVGLFGGALRVGEPVIGCAHLIAPPSTHDPYLVRSSAFSAANRVKLVIPPGVYCG